MLSPINNPSFIDMDEDYDTDSDEEEVKDIAIASYLGYISLFDLKVPRNSFVVRDRLNWRTHVDTLLLEGPNKFAQLYRMSEQSFNILLGLIYKDLPVDEVMSTFRTKKAGHMAEIQTPFGGQKGCMCRFIY